MPEQKKVQPAHTMDLRGRTWQLWPDGTITHGPGFSYTGMRLTKPLSAARLKDRVIKEEIAALKRELH